MNRKATHTIIDLLCGCCCHLYFYKTFETCDIIYVKCAWMVKLITLKLLIFRTLNESKIFKNWSLRKHSHGRIDYAFRVPFSLTFDLYENVLVLRKQWLGFRVVYIYKFTIIVTILCNWLKTFKTCDLWGHFRFYVVPFNSDNPS